MKRILLKSTIENWEHTLTKQQIIESHERLRELLDQSLDLLTKLNAPNDHGYVKNFVQRTRKELV